MHYKKLHGITFIFFGLITFSFLFKNCSYRVLNEFIMKNPSLENKKDQRDLQVRHSEFKVAI